MASIEEVQTDFGEFKASWHDLRPFLAQYLPRDTPRLHKADRLFNKAERHLGKAIRAENQRRELQAWWCYALSLAAMRDHGKLMDELVERGLQAQEESKNLGKVSS